MIDASGYLKTGGEDNQPNLQFLIDVAPNKSTIKIPSGKWHFSSQINILGKAITLEGSDDTNLYFENGSSGIVLRPAGVVQVCRIKDLNLICSGERAGTNGNAIDSETVTDIQNVFISNFGGYGVKLWGDITVRISNVSHSILNRVTVAECGSDGFYCQGGDASVIGLFNVDARDCDGYGLNDSGFLGSNFFNCMCHINKKGNYHTMEGNLNNRTTFTACYCEGGSPISHVYGETMIFGGLWSGGVVCHDYAVAYWNGTVGNPTKEKKYKEPSLDDYHKLFQ